MKKRRLNLYSCGCGNQLISEDIDQGVTPFMMPCSCEDKGSMLSHMYRVDEEYQVYPADIIWYKPTKEQYLKLSKGMKDHVDQGGLDYKVNSPKAEYLDTIRKGREK